MAQLIYAMQFKGQAGPVSESSPNVLKAATSSPSCSITSVVGPGGVSSDQGEVTDNHFGVIFVS